MARRDMLNRLYQWTLAKAAHPQAEFWLFIFAFAESSFFPIPPHPLLGLMCLARPERALRYGVVCTVASVTGGLLGYAIGHFAFAAFGQSLLQWLGLTESFPVAACYLREFGAEIILVKGATPIPYKLITITAGFIHLDLWTFIWASVVSRGFLFLLVGGLFWKFGRPIKAFMDKYLGLVTIAFVVLVVGGILLAGALTGHGGDDRCKGAAHAATAPAG
jgi:membrane protein YqaA with SNARE-associated domain